MSGARERGRALLDQAHAVGEELLDPFAARKGVVNPDSRCPCGSRRKHKRCCMGARPPRVPGDLHALKARARTALIDFAVEELGEPLRITDADDPVVVPTEESRWAWLLYWRRFDGFTLADRFLSDPGRGDVWLRRWLEAASGTPPDAFEVLSADGRSARLAGLADLDGSDRDVQLARPDEIRVGEVVFGAPVR
ncbi:MAG: SEC-C domain-containing protein [Myxococcota bacterium]